MNREPWDLAQRCVTSSGRRPTARCKWRPLRVRGSAAPRRRPRCGCRRRPFGRTASAPDASPRRRARRCASCAAPSPRGLSGHGSRRRARQRPRPRPLRRAIWPSVTPNTRADPDVGGRIAANRSRSASACGVMATTAPAASWSVFERRTVRRPEPSVSRATSAHVRAAASERRSPASLITLTIAISRAVRQCVSTRPLSAPRVGGLAGEPAHDHPHGAVRALSGTIEA